MKLFIKKRIDRGMRKKEKSMQEPRKWATVAVEREILEKLQEDAKAQDRSVSWILGRILKQHYLIKNG